MLAGLDAMGMAWSGRVGILNSGSVGVEEIVELAERDGRGEGAIVIGELVSIEADENIVVAGEILGARAVETIDGVLLAGADAVMGNPSSSKIFRAVVKSASFLNFTWIRRT